MIKTIKLNDELIKVISSGSIKAFDLVKFLVAIEGITYNKEIALENTSINMLIIEGHKVTGAEIDNWTNEIVLTLGDEILSTTENIIIRSAVTCTSEFVHRNDLVTLADSDNNYYIAKGENYIFNCKDNEPSYFTGNYIKVNKDIFYLSSGTLYDEIIKEHNLFPNLTIEEIHNIYNFVNNLNLDNVA